MMGIEKSGGSTGVFAQTYALGHSASRCGSFEFLNNYLRQTKFSSAAFWTKCDD